MGSPSTIGAKHRAIATPRMTEDEHALAALAREGDRAALLSEGITVQTCAVCGANFIAAFALLNVWLLIARPRP